MHKDGNILLLTSPSGTPEQARELARELDIDLPPRDFLAVDHSSYDVVSATESGKHDVILIPRPGVSDSTQNYFAGSSGEGEGEVIAFRGTGHGLGNRPLLFPVLSAGRAAYTYDTKEDFAYAEEPWTAGRQMQYVTAMQARNNARVVVAGSTEMFSDKFFDMMVKAPKAETEVHTANRKFAEQITSWVFMETGVVRVNAVRHYLTNTTDAQVNPNVYRVKNDIVRPPLPKTRALSSHTDPPPQTFEIELSEWSSTQWKPFTVPSSDHLQLEFTMLDPYYRLPLLASPSSSTPTSSVYATSFKAPDQHGIFAFKVNYKRPFVTYIDEKYTVTLRHFAHNEYTRSWDISGAWVWIAGIAATIGGFTVFCALWLYSAPTERGVKKTQ